MKQPRVLRPMASERASVLDADQVLLERSRSGDTAAFRTIVERYQGTVAATVVGMVGPGSDAEDIGQETFIRFFRSIDKFREESALGTYLTRIAINLSLNLLKRRRREHRFFHKEAVESDGDMQGAMHIASAEPTPDVNLQTQELKEQVRNAIGSLGPDQRAVVVLRLIDGHSVRETAEMLEIPAGTVLSRLARAQARLRTSLSRYLEPDEYEQ